MDDLVTRIYEILADLAFGAGFDGMFWELKWHKDPDGRECLAVFVNPWRGTGFFAYAAFCYRDSPKAKSLAAMSDQNLTDYIKTSWFMMMGSIWSRSAPVAA